MKFKILLLFIISNLLTSCIYHEMNVYQMVGDIYENRLNNKDARIDIIWYVGTDKMFHYLGNVYHVLGTTNYKIPKDQILIKQEMPYTDDPSKFKFVWKIDQIWTAGRLTSDRWVEDTLSKKEGIVLKITIEPPEKDTPLPKP